MESTTIFDRISRWSLYALAFLIPVFFLPVTQDALDYQKQAILTIVVLVGVLSWIAAMLQAQTATIRVSWQLLSLFAFVVVGIASVIFSLWPAGSFWGFPLSIGDSLLSQILFALFALLVMNAFSKPEHLFKLVAVFAFAVGTACLFAGAQVFQLFSFLPFVFVKTPLFNSIGSPNAIAVVAAILLPLTLVLAFLSRLLLRLFLWVIAAILFATLVFVQFSIAWFALIAGLLVLLGFGMWNIRKRTEFGWISFPMAFLVLSLFFLLVPMELPGIPQLPPEVSPSWQGEIDIIAKTLSKDHLLLGSGPGTFVFDYAQFHSPVLNQTIFWGTRFASGSSQLLDIVVTFGVLGIVAFLLLICTTAVAAFRKLFSSKAEASHSLSWMLGLGMTASFVALLVSFLLYPASFTTWFLFWMLIGGLGMFAAKEARFSLAPPSLLSVGSSFIFLLTLVFGLGLLFIGGQRYAAEVFYLRGARLAQQGDAAKAIEQIQVSLRLNPDMDLYWRDLGQLFVARIGTIGQDTALSQEQKQQQTQTLVTNAAAAVQQAAAISKANVANWNVQGSVYQNLLAVPGAKDLAVQAYEQAKLLEPASPFAWGELGRIYILFSQQQDSLTTLRDESLQKAVENLEYAVQLKSDYAQARFLLAAAYDLQGKSAEATAQLEALKQTSPKDVGIAFQLGTVYWQKGDTAKAQEEFLRAKQLDPTYSNAIYMLGLAYDKLGDGEAALKEFERVGTLNPDNEDIKHIIANLKAGKPALDGVVPAQPPVEQTPPEIKKEK